MSRRLTANTAVDETFIEGTYQELRRLAQRKLQREPSAPTLQVTALVHEAWLRIDGSNQKVDWASRAHFYNAAALAMRRILVDRARRRTGADVPVLEPLPIEMPSPLEREELDILRLDEALDHLERMDPKAFSVVHLRFFVGLTVPAIAAVTGLSPRTVKREWHVARLWLYDRLVGDEGRLAGDEVPNRAAGKLA